MSEKSATTAAMAKKKSTAAASASAAAAASRSNVVAAPTSNGGWERATVRKCDLSPLRRQGLLPANQEKVRLAGPEIVPRPEPGWRVMFIPFVVRGLCFPVHPFLRNLLFVYGIQLHHLTPNSLLHLAVYFTLCECFLGIHPHWGLFKHLFRVKRQSGHFDAGSFGISVRPGAEYFDLNMVDSAQGWRRRWFYIRDEPSPGQVNGLEPFSAGSEIRKKRTWANELNPVEAAEVEKLMERVRFLRNTAGQEVTGFQIMATFIRRRVQPLQARAHGMWMYAGAADPTRVSTEDLSPTEVETRVKSLTKLTLGDDFLGTPPVAPYGADNQIPEINFIYPFTLIASILDP